MRALADRLRVPVRVVTVRVDPGPNLESRARDARHGALPAGTLLGHTADDQAETVILNLVRGAGPLGLAAMPADGRRPMLRLRRSETRELCRRAGITTTDDDMNRDLSFTRVRVRVEVLPLLCDVAGRDVVPLIARTAELMAAVSERLERQASELDPTDARALTAADQLVGRTAVRAWLASSTGSSQPFDLADVDRVLDVAAGAAKATDVSGGWHVSRHRQRLRISGPGGRER